MVIYIYDRLQSLWLSDSRRASKLISHGRPIVERASRRMVHVSVVRIGVEVLVLVDQLSLRRFCIRDFLKRCYNCQDLRVGHLLQNDIPQYPTLALISFLHHTFLLLFPHLLHPQRTDHR